MFKGGMGLKTNLGSFRGNLMKFGPLVNITNVTRQIKFYEATTELAFYAGFRIFHWWKGC